MNFNLSEEQIAFRDVVRRWVNEELPKDLMRKLEADEENYPFEIWEKLKAQGFFGVGIPEEWGGLGGDGDEDFEGGAASDLAFDLDPALVLFDDSVNGGQSEAGAFANFFRREERLEDAGQGSVVHAVPGVGDVEADEVSLACLRLAAGVGGIELLEFGADGEAAAARHGVARVDGKVHEDLFHHAGISVDGREIVGGMPLQLHLFADAGPQDFCKVVDHLVQVQQLRLHDLLAAEHEQLAGEIGGAFGGDGDLAR